MLTRYNFQTYEEIPLLISEYILTVAESKSLFDIPLEDINSFLTGLEEYAILTDNKEIRNDNRQSPSNPI